jgi:hypothetical protein
MKLQCVFCVAWCESLWHCTHYGKLPDCSNIARIVLKSDQKSGQILQSGNEGSSGQIPFPDITNPVRNTRIVIFVQIASTIRATHYILNMSLLDLRRNFPTPFFWSVHPPSTPTFIPKVNLATSTFLSNAALTSAPFFSLYSTVNNTPSTIKMSHSLL